MNRPRHRFTGIARPAAAVPPEILDDVGDLVERLEVRRQLDSPEEALVLSLVATAATLERLCGALLATYPVFSGLGPTTRIEALHFLFILYDVTREEEARNTSVRLTQRKIGAIMKVLGRGNETSIPNALKNAFHDYLDGGAAAKRPRLNARGLELAEAISSRYYARMEELFAAIPQSKALASLSRLLRTVRDSAATLESRLADESLEP